MPTYEYICDACGKEYEKFQSIMVKPDRVCPSCKARKVRRKIGIGSAILFKGSGFYETDYRSDGYTKAAEAERKSSDGAKDSKVASADAGKTSAAQSDGATSAATKSGASASDASSTNTKNSGAGSGTSRTGASNANTGANSSGSSNANAGANSSGSSNANAGANSSGSSSSRAGNSEASQKPRATPNEQMVAKAVHPSRVGRGHGNLRRKKK